MFGDSHHHYAFSFANCEEISKHLLLKKMKRSVSQKKEKKLTNSGLCRVDAWQVINNVYTFFLCFFTWCLRAVSYRGTRDHSLTHSVPSMKLSEMNGLASSSVSSCDHATLPE